jgi:predicted aspartyl protease
MFHFVIRLSFQKVAIPPHRTLNCARSHVSFLISSPRWTVCRGWNQTAVKSPTTTGSFLLALLTGVLAAASSAAVSAETIALKREQGTFVVPVVLNGSLTLNFTIDSGAADVSIPSDVVSTLVRTGTIEDGDFIGSQQYQLADGSVQRARRIRIRSLRVGSVELQNVVASEAPLAGMPLLGQSFLARLPSWSIDNQRHVLVIDQSTGNTSATSASPAEAVKSEQPTPVKHHKGASPGKPDPAEQLAQQQCEYWASQSDVDKRGPLEKMNWMQGCMPGRIKKIHEYANVPPDLLAEQHQADCANEWDRAVHQLRFNKAAVHLAGYKTAPCRETNTCVDNERDLLKLRVGRPDDHRGDPCTEADLLSRGGAPE